MSLQELRAVLDRNNYIVLDTETSGIERPAEIVQIAVVSCEGETLLNILLNPAGDIPPAAYRVHGISKLDCADAPRWPAVKPELLRLMAGKDVISYNAVFDRKLMHWTDEAWKLPHTDYKADSPWCCAMEAYAEFCGEINEYYGSYKWQKLTNAMQQQKLRPSGEHSALGDALMTFTLITWMDNHQGAREE